MLLSTAKSVEQATKALPGEVPKVMRWRHQSPRGARNPRDDRIPVPRGQQHHTTRAQMSHSKLQSTSNVVDVLDNVEHDDRVKYADLVSDILSERRPPHVGKPGLLAGLHSVLGNLDAIHVEKFLGLLQEEPVSTSYFEKLAGWHRSTQKIELMAEFLTQDFLAAGIIDVSFLNFPEKYSAV